MSPTFDVPLVAFAGEEFGTEGVDGRNGLDRRKQGEKETDDDDESHFGLAMVEQW